MITKLRRDRVPYLQASIATYVRQTYRPTELIIVFDQGEPESIAQLQEHVAALGRPDIRVIGPVERATLGLLRNTSVQHARGEVVCQWDDDDLYHPERIRRQLETMTEAGTYACYLQDVLQYLAATRTLHWTNWSMTPVRAHPGSMMCVRARVPLYPTDGAESALGEDRVVLAHLQQHGSVAVLAGEPHLFVYVTHGDNTWPTHHHRMLVDTLSVSAGFLRRRETQIRQGIEPFDFGPGDITVMGSNGPAFTVSSGCAH